MDDSYGTSLKSVYELSNFVGKEIGVSKWMTISQDRITKFADATDDRQWIHLDGERARSESPYKVTIAHGFLIVSLASKFCQEVLHIEDQVMGINYGLDRVRFTSATPVDAQIRSRISLMTFDEIENGAKYKLKLVFEIKDQAKPACVAEFIALTYVSPEGKKAP